MKDYTKDEPLKESEYLKTKIFKGLKNLNDGFNAEGIYYFAEADFEIVLQRVEEKGILIFGIEPWIDENYYGVLTYEDYNTVATDIKWREKAFSKFKKSGKELMYSTSYQVPKKLFQE